MRRSRWRKWAPDAQSVEPVSIGIVGAKVWFIVLHRRAHRMEGWCIQGFIAGSTLAAAILLVVLNMPIGVFLDVTAPGLLVAMAVGRVGCFFAGCCGGPPTASRWGVWSSDQRVGARRLPTQLLESVLAGLLGLLGLVAVVGHGLVGGAFFIGAWRPTPWGDRVCCICAPSRARRGWVGWQLQSWQRLRSSQPSSCSLCNRRIRHCVLHLSAALSYLRPANGDTLKPTRKRPGNELFQALSV